jgi:hypothetical protein
MYKVCIVIPVHNANPSAFELISYKQCCSVLEKHAIFIIAPEGLDLKRYKGISENPQTIYVPAFWQNSLMNYNKLKLSNFFYSLFQDYEFLLTYELDAFVFRDELYNWCSDKFDYIGAPWFEGYDKPTDKLIGVGNSGFSLRRISVMKKLLKKFYYKDPVKYQVGNKVKLKALLQSPYYWARNQFGENFTIQNAGFVHEDLVLAQMARRFPAFKIASIDEASRFSFEANPSLLYRRNNNQLPMGCHAWWKYDFNFWKPHIEAFGHNLIHQ